ncbi:MAG: hypothetical protein AB7T49_07910 [Oligoflexales bacterium]
MRNLYIQTLLVATLLAVGALFIQMRDNNEAYNPTLEDFDSSSMGSLTQTEDFFRQTP